MRKKIFVVDPDAHRNTFLGSEGIQENVSLTGVFLGRNIAILRKFKLDDAYDDKKSALKLGKPIYGWYVVPMAVKGQFLAGDDTAPLVVNQVELKNEEGELVREELTFTPNDYFHYKKGMTDGDILRVLNENNGASVEQRIFKSPYEATKVATVLNRNAFNTLSVAIQDINNQRDMLSTMMQAQNAPYQD